MQPAISWHQTILVRCARSAREKCTLWLFCDSVSVFNAVTTTSVGVLTAVDSVLLICLARTTTGTIVDLLDDSVISHTKMR